MSWTERFEEARATAGQHSWRQPRWPRLLIGAVLLWRALCLGAGADAAGVLDARFVGEWSSPGLNRSVKLAFARYTCQGAEPMRYMMFIKHSGTGTAAPTVLQGGTDVPFVANLNG